MPHWFKDFPFPFLLPGIISPNVYDQESAARPLGHRPGGPPRSRVYSESRTVFLETTCCSVGRCVGHKLFGSVPVNPHAEKYTYPEDI